MILPFLAFILVAQGSLLLLHFFVYKTIVGFFEISSYLDVIRVVFFILSISFFTSSIISFRYFNIFNRAFYFISSYWLGIAYFLLVASILCWAFFGVYSWAGWTFNFKIAAGIIFGLAIAFSIVAIVNAQIIRVTKISITIPNLPSDWKGKSVVWASDLHLGNIHGIGFGNEIRDKIISLKPEALFIGGDLYDGARGEEDAFAKTMSIPELKGKEFFITGNHEEFFDDTNYLNAVKNAGIEIIDNKKIDLDGIQLAGVGWKEAQNKDIFEKTLASLNIDKNKPSILLNHAPLYLDMANEAGVNFQISGHTHQGQMFPFSIATHFFWKGYDYGLKKFGNMDVYTSSGAGTWGPPLRLGTIAEIVQITLN